MIRRHLGRQWHCRTIRTINLDCVSSPQATQWPDGWSKHISQWLACGNSTPRFVFPISKTCWGLGGPPISRDTKKDCGERGCPTDHRSDVLAGGDKVIEQERRLPLMALFGLDALARRCLFVRGKADFARDRAQVRKWTQSRRGSLNKGTPRRLGGCWRQHPVTPSRYRFL
jgi:hypothetical protein